MVAPQTLVAIDPTGAVDPGPILTALGDALINHETVANPKRSTSITHRITFDAHQARNTEVHAVGYHAGFLVHIEPATP